MTMINKFFIIFDKNIRMPTLSMFYGIIIRMYYAPKEHNPPHIHAYYQNYRATFLIDTAEVADGIMPTKQQRLIQAWMEIHKEDLFANWQLCQNGEKPFKIDPLN